MTEQKKMWTHVLRVKDSNTISEVVTYISGMLIYKSAAFNAISYVGLHVCNKVNTSSVQHLCQ